MCETAKDITLGVGLPDVIIREPSAFIHCTSHLPDEPKTAIRFHHRVTLHLGVNMHPEGSQIGTPGGGVPTG